MVRRKPISISDRLGRFNRLIAPNVPDALGAVSLQQDLIDKIDAYRAEAAKQALSKYNAESFKPIIVEQPDATFVAPTGNINEKVPKSKRTIINGSRTPVKSYTGKQREFVNDIYNSYYRNLVDSGSNPVDAKRQARHLAQKSAYETGYGQSIYARHNYGGHEVPDGKGGVRKLNFTSMDDYTKADIKLLDRKWKPWRNAKNEDEFVTAITTDYGQGRYNAVNSNYRNTYKGMSKRMNSYLNMRCGGGVKRPKAWVGAVIGAASSLLGGILNADAQEKQLKEQRRIQAQKDAVTRAENMTQALGLTQNAQLEYENRFRLPYAKGGRRRLRDGVSITDGGYAIPIGDDTFLLRGGSHEQVNETGQTGIGLNIGGNEIEAEGGEVVQKTPKEVRVFSDTITLPNGLTPAEAVEYGYNKNDIFKIQQSMNGDYGKRRLRNGGRLTRPVGRICAEDGIVVRNGRQYKKVRYPNSDKTYWEDLGPANSSNGFLSRVWGNIKEALNSRPQPTGKKPKTGFTASNMPASNGPYNANIRTVNKTNTNNSDGDEISKYLASKGLANTKENRRLYTLANNKYGITQAGMEYTGTRDGGTIDEIIVNGNAPYTDLSGAASNNRENLSYLDRDNNRPVARTSSNSTSTGTSSTPARNSSGRRSLRNRGNSSTSTSKVPTSISEVPTTEQLLSVIPQNAAITTPSYTNPTEQVLRDMQEAAKPKEAPVTTPVINSAEDYFKYYNDNLNYNQNTRGNQQLESQGITPEVKAPTVEDTTTRTDVQATPFKRYNTADWIGLGADLIGSLGSALINYNAAGRIAEPPAPVRLMPGKLITNYNIAPRLSQVSMLRNRGLRDTDELVSSAGRLNARNRVNMLSNLQADQLWGEKTNREVELLNADTMNQQNVNAQNVQAYNAWQDRLAEIRNRKYLGQAQALQYGLSGISDAVGNFLDAGRQNYADNQAMKYYTALLPDEGREWLRRNGVVFKKGGRFRLRNM